VDGQLQDSMNISGYRTSGDVSRVRCAEANDLSAMRRQRFSTEVPLRLIGLVLALGPVSVAAPASVNSEWPRPGPASGATQAPGAE
jgi:hypothetical protein